jgi:hypothetical protein
LEIKSIATPADGLTALLDAADQSTMAVAAKHAGGANDAAKGSGQDKTKDNSGKVPGGNSKGAAQPEKKK